MATLDELQAQLTALAQRVNEITAPPDDYYTHRFSGEEIDNAVGRVAATAGSGAITAGDVGAAPDGYGLGTNRLPVIDNSAFSSVLPAGFYLYRDLEHPIGGSQVGILLSLGSNYSYTGLSTQIFTIYGSVLIRNPTQNNYNPEWDWLNPPMQLGVEYRTTERYHRKPVYAKLISLGLLPDNSLKVVAVSDNIHRVVDLKLDVQGSNTVVNNAVYSRISAAANGVTIETVYPASSLGEAWAYVKYTKTTD